jgi:hypothetical protein
MSLEFLWLIPAIIITIAVICVVIREQLGDKYLAAY